MVSRQFRKLIFAEFSQMAANHKEQIMQCFKSCFGGHKRILY